MAASCPSSLPSTKLCDTRTCESFAQVERSFVRGGQTNSGQSVAGRRRPYGDGKASPIDMYRPQSLEDVIKAVADSNSSISSISSTRSSTDLGFDSTRSSPESVCYRGVIDAECNLSAPLERARSVLSPNIGIELRSRQKLRRPNSKWSDASSGTARTPFAGHDIGCGRQQCQEQHSPLTVSPRTGGHTQRRKRQRSGSARRSFYSTPSSPFPLQSGVQPQLQQKSDAATARFAIERLLPHVPDVVIRRALLACGLQRKIPTWERHSHSQAPVSLPFVEEAPQGSAVMLISISGLDSLFQHTDESMYSESKRGDCRSKGEASKRFSHSDILDNFYNKLLDTVDRFRGDVIQIRAGALIALFTEENNVVQPPDQLTDAFDGGENACERAGRAALACAAHRGVYVAGAVDLCVKAALTSGGIRVAHLGTDQRTEVVLCGTAFHHLGTLLAAAECGTVVSSSEFVATSRHASRSERLVFAAATSRYHGRQLLAIQSSHLTEPDHSNAAGDPCAFSIRLRQLLMSVVDPTEAQRAAAMLRAYLPCGVGFQPAIRLVSTISVVFAGMPQDHPLLALSLHRAMIETISQVRSTIACLNECVIDDRGAKLVVTCGLPWRGGAGADSASALRKRQGKGSASRLATALCVALQRAGIRVSVGVACGPSFLGLVGSHRRKSILVLGKAVQASAALGHRAISEILLHPGRDAEGRELLPVLVDASVPLDRDVLFDTAVIPPLLIPGLATACHVAVPRWAPSFLMSDLTWSSGVDNLLGRKKKIAGGREHLLVGRGRIIRLVREICANGWPVLISGDEGAGRTAILRALAVSSELIDNGVLTLAVTCNPTQTHTPYALLSTLLATMLPASDISRSQIAFELPHSAHEYFARNLNLSDFGAACGRVRELDSGLRPVATSRQALDFVAVLNDVGIRVPVGCDSSVFLDQGARQSVLLQLLLGLMYSVLKVHPMQILIDDACAADVSSLSMLIYIAREFCGRGLSLVMTARAGSMNLEFEKVWDIPAEQYEQITASSPTPDGRVARLTLPLLDVGDVQTVFCDEVSRHCSTEDLKQRETGHFVLGCDSELAFALYQQSKGNPLQVCTLARSLLACKGLFLERSESPSGLHVIIRVRETVDISFLKAKSCDQLLTPVFLTLSEHAQLMLRVGSLFGTDFLLSDVIAILLDVQERSEGEAESGLDITNLICQITSLHQNDFRTDMLDMFVVVIEPKTLKMRFTSAVAQRIVRNIASSSRDAQLFACAAARVIESRAALGLMSASFCAPWAAELRLEGKQSSKYIKHCDVAAEFAWSVNARTDAVCWSRRVLEQSDATPHSSLNANLILAKALVRISIGSDQLQDSSGMQFLLSALSISGVIAALNLTSLMETVPRLRTVAEQVHASTVAVSSIWRSFAAYLHDRADSRMQRFSSLLETMDPCSRAWLFRAGEQLVKDQSYSCHAKRHQPLSGQALWLASEDASLFHPGFALACAVTTAISLCSIEHAGFALGWIGRFVARSSGIRSFAMLCEPDTAQAIDDFLGHCYEIFPRIKTTELQQGVGICRWITEIAMLGDCVELIKLSAGQRAATAARAFKLNGLTSDESKAHNAASLAFLQTSCFQEADHHAGRGERTAMLVGDMALARDALRLQAVVASALNHSACLHDISNRIGSLPLHLQDQLCAGLKVLHVLDLVRALPYDSRRTNSISALVQQLFACNAVELLFSDLTQATDQLFAMGLHELCETVAACEPESDNQILCKLHRLLERQVEQAEVIASASPNGLIAVYRESGRGLLALFRDRDPQRALQIWKHAERIIQLADNHVISWVRLRVAVMLGDANEIARQLATLRELGFACTDTQALLIAASAAAMPLNRAEQGESKDTRPTTHESSQTSPAITWLEENVPNVETSRFLEAGILSISELEALSDDHLITLGVTRLADRVKIADLRSRSDFPSFNIVAASIVVVGVAAYTLGFVWGRRAVRRAR